MRLVTPPKSRVKKNLDSILPFFACKKEDGSTIKYQIVIKT